VRARIGEGEGKAVKEGMGGGDRKESELRKDGEKRKEKEENGKGQEGKRARGGKRGEEEREE
jgi:hypothetical protein